MARRGATWSRLALGLALVALGLVAWLAYGPGDGRTASRDTTELATAGEVTSSERLSEQDGVAEVESTDRSPAQVAEADRNRSLLRCSGGDAVAGAAITWTPMRPGFLTPWAGWAGQDWSAVQAATIEARSGPDGAFSIEVDSPGVPGALWITHEQHRPLLVMTSATGLGLPSVLELEHGEPVRVRVSGPDGRGREGAVVEQLVPVPDDARADLHQPQAERVLWRAHATGQDGVVRVASWEGPLLLRASLGAERSEVWIGEARAEIELSLHPSFQVTGRVVASPGLEGTQRVVCGARFGNQTQPLAVVPVEGGSYGPVTLPVLDADACSFRLEGWNVEVREVEVDVPAPGELVTVDFEARPGLDLWTFVEDAEGEAVPGSVSTFSWEQDGVRVEARGERLEDGHALVRGVRPGIATLEGRAPGFSPRKAGPYEVPPDSPVTYVVALEGGAPLMGVVQAGGRPVEDFEITFWETPVHPTTIPLRERVDGSFSVQAAQDRLVYVTATAAGRGASPVRTVRTGSAEASRLVLELTELVTARGVVVDGVSQDPVPGALVQCHALDRETGVVAGGPRVRTGSDGRFEAPIAPAGRSLTRIEAPSHGTAWVDEIATVGEVLDFGTIALRGRQDLTIRIPPPSSPDSAKRLVRASGADELPWRSFDAAGSVAYQGVSPGLYCIAIRGADELEFWIELEPGSDWDVALPVGGKATLAVEVDTGGRPPERLFVRAVIPTAGSQSIFHLRSVPEDGLVEIEGIPTGDFDLFLVDLAEREIGSARGTVLPQETLHRVRLAPFEVEHELLVTDPGGAPIDGGVVTLWGDSAAAALRCSLDGQGRGQVRGLVPGETWWARVQHPELGDHSRIQVHVPPAEADPIRIVFDPSRTVEVALVDDTLPLAGITATLSHAGSAFELGSVTTDAGGSASWDHIGPGVYTVRVAHPTVWPTSVEVEAGMPGQRTEVQVRRSGDLELTVRRLDGSPVRDQGLELTPTELAGAVQDWLDDGRVHSSTGALRTDAQGELSLEGLPRGTYAWSIAGGEGQLRVIAGVVESVLLTVP